MKFKDLIIIIDALNQIIINFEYFKEFKLNDIKGYFLLLEVSYNIKIDYEKSIKDNKLNPLIEDLKKLKHNILLDYQKKHNLE